MLLGFRKGLSMRYPQCTWQEQTIIGTVNSSQLFSTKWSTRHTILGCDELTGTHYSKVSIKFAPSPV